MNRLALTFVLLATHGPLILTAQSVETILSPAPDLQRPTYRLSSPLLTVGGLHSDPAYEIVAYTAVSVTHDGKLVVAPTGGAERPRSIRVYDAPGRLVSDFGRSGQGPGEFGVVSSIRVRGDTLLVHDRRNTRLTLFRMDGTVISSAGAAGQGLCCIGKQWFVIADGPNPLSFDAGDRPARDSMRVQIGAVGGSPSAGQRQFFVPGYERPICIVARSANGLCGSALMRPFVSQPIVSIAGDLIVYALPDQFEFRTYSADGTLRRISRAAVPPVPLRRAELDSARADLASGFSGDRLRALNAALDRTTFPTSRPLFTRMVGEESGAVWVSSCNGADDERCWSRFGPDGRLDGVALIPDGWTVATIVHGYVVLQRYDPATEARRLAVHRLERTGSTVR
jgi:hypothetical protein